MSIEVKNISKSFGSFKALKNVSLNVPTGELIALLGPSGCGKTTLLRIIAGLEKPDEGSVYMDEQDATHHSVRERSVGFVFQHYALFRHMTVFENVAFGLRVRPKRTRPSREEIEDKVHALLKLVQLDWLANRYPTQLSGGQRQRVALARALAVEPKLLLLDEPFGALDAQVRRELRKWLRRLHDELHITSVFVTHDQEEAMELANFVVVMNKGEIEQLGTPEEVYHQPASPFVYQFLGNVNLFRGRIQDGYIKLDEPVIDSGQTEEPHQPLYIRPHELHVAKQESTGSLSARILYINAAGPYVKVELQTNSGAAFEVEISHEEYRILDLQKGATVYVSPRESRIYLEDYAI